MLREGEGNSQYSSGKSGSEFKGDSSESAIVTEGPSGGLPPMWVDYVDTIRSDLTTNRKNSELGSAKEEEISARRGRGR